MATRAFVQQAGSSPGLFRLPSLTDDSHLTDSRSRSRSRSSRAVVVVVVLDK